jgi:hypothetical protein
MPPATRRKSTRGGGKDDDGNKNTDDSTMLATTKKPAEGLGKSDEPAAAGRNTTRRRSGRLLQLYAPKLPVVSSAVVFGLFALLAPVLAGVGTFIPRYFAVQTPVDDSYGPSLLSPLCSLTLFCSPNTSR